MAGGSAGRRQNDESYVSPVLKWIIFFSNFFFWVVGLGILGIGIWATYETQRLTHKGVSSFFDVIFDIGIICVVLGAFIFILGFLGCIGALRENTLLLKIFAIILGLIFLLEVAFVIYCFVFSNQVKKDITNTLKTEAITRYRDEDKRYLDLKNIIDWIQENFDCCGVGEDGYKDWSLNRYFNCTKSNPSHLKCAVPYSCCVKENNVDADFINTQCGYGAQEQDIIQATKSIHTQGCIGAFIKWATDEKLYIAGGVLIGVALLQIFAIFLTRILAGQVEDQKSRWV